MEKTIVFIDAGYLDQISKYFGGGLPLKYDINQLAITIAKESNLWCEEVFYYTAQPYQDPQPSEDQKLRRKRHDNFINKLEKIPGFTVRQGRCQKTDNGYRQKGVDTLLTMDLTFRCSKKDIKTIILIACDTDFVPILNHIRKEFKTYVILAYFFDYKRGSKFSMSNHILTACDLKILVNHEHFKKSTKNDTNKS